MRFKNGYRDDGSLVNNNDPNGQTCPNCGSKNFKETVSREKCNNCDYEVDYWGEGANETAQKAINRMHQENKERQLQEDKKYWEEEKAAYERLNSNWEDYYE